MFYKEKKLTKGRENKTYRDAEKFYKNVKSIWTKDGAEYHKNFYKRQKTVGDQHRRFF